MLARTRIAGGLWEVRIAPARDAVTRLAEQYGRDGRIMDGTDERTADGRFWQFAGESDMPGTVAKDRD